MIHTFVALACLVVPQVGVVRDVPAGEIATYRNAVVVPCILDDRQALDYWRSVVYAHDQAECPGCFPWKQEN